MPLSIRGTCPKCGKPVEVRPNRSSLCVTCYNDRYVYDACPGCGERKTVAARTCLACRWQVVQPRAMSPEEIAWLAGIIEGEGTIGVGAKVYLAVAMTDLDIVQRLQGLTGVGRIYEDRKRARDHYKRTDVWQVVRQAHVVHVLRSIYPWLGDRRRSSADRALARLANAKRVLAEAGSIADPPIAA